MQNILELIEHIRAEHKVFRDVKDIGKDIMVTCPFHLDGMEDTPSLGIHKETGKYNCFACGAKGNFVKLIALIMEVPYDEANAWLLEHSDFEVNTRGNLLLVEHDDDRPYEWQRDEKDLIRAVQFLERRRIPNAWRLARQFHIGGDGEWFKIGIRRPNGTVRYVKKRHLREKRFLNTRGVNKANHLFGLYEAMSEVGAGCTLWVCESEIDALAVWGSGQIAVAFGGALFSEKQLSMMQMWLRPKVIVDGFDKDDAGRKAWKEFCEQYIQYDPDVIMQTTVAVEGCKDINDYIRSHNDLEYMLDSKYRYDRPLRKWFKEIPNHKLGEELWIDI